MTRKKRLQLEAQAAMKLKGLSIMEEFETIRHIIKNKSSMSRFGDGEFRVAQGFTCSSQMKCKTLSQKMLGILKNDTKNLLVGILKPELGWARYYLKRPIAEVMNYNTQYYSMGVTRTDQAPHIYCTEYWELCKKIWEGRDVVIIYGGKRIGNYLGKMKPSQRDALIEYGRSRKFEVSLHNENGQDLVGASIGKYIDAFDNCKSISYLPSYYICASLDYNNIIRQVKEYPKSTLVFMALGSAATCLAKDLHLLGYQALDMGHWGRYYHRFKIGNPKL